MYGTPHHEYALEKYQTKRLVFREWELAGKQAHPLLLVDWPQHPSRSPFSDPFWWRAACEQFAGTTLLSHRVDPDPATESGNGNIGP